MPNNSPEYKRAYYQKNRAKIDAQSRAYKQSLQDAIWEIKGSTPCTDCGEQYDPWVMQFDHIDPDTKSANIGQLITRGAKKALFEEIEKCEIVCANCHADRTYRQMQEKKLDEIEGGLH